MADASDSGSEDDLDKLTRSFEAQASEDLQKAAHYQARIRQTQRKGMKATREQGLQAPISEKSKGYQMLAKMGYEKGSGLGRAKTGRAEPIELVMKGTRTGLGVDEDQKRKEAENLQNQVVRASKRQHLGEALELGFAGLQAARLIDRKFEAQLKAARKVVETLDRRKGYERSFMWPPEPKPEGEEEENKDTGDKSEDALKEVEASKEASETWEGQPVRERLVGVLTYLRTTHQYCLHCGCQYNDEADLESNCPGLMEEDH